MVSCAPVGAASSRVVAALRHSRGPIFSAACAHLFRTRTAASAPRPLGQHPGIGAPPTRAGAPHRSNHPHRRSSFPANPRCALFESSCSSPQPAGPPPRRSGTRDTAPISRPKVPQVLAARRTRAATVPRVVGLMSSFSRSFRVANYRWHLEQTGPFAASERLAAASNGRCIVVAWLESLVALGRPVSRPNLASSDHPRAAGNVARSPSNSGNVPSDVTQ